MRVFIPKDFVLGPVFAACPQTGPRRVLVGGRVYEIGGFHPLDPSKRPPALDVRHARALMTLLTFRQSPYAPASVRFSMREFCRRYARSSGGRYVGEIRALLGDLIDSYFRVFSLDGRVARTFRLVERVVIRQVWAEGMTLHEGQPPRLKQTWIEEVVLSPDFVGMLNNLGNVHSLDLETLSRIRSPLAQAIYLFLPSRAAHHNEKVPFEITATRLLEQVGHPVPPTCRLREKLFLQNARSVMDHLQRLPTLSGILRVALNRTADGSDVKLSAWIEGREKPAEPRVEKPLGKLARAFLAGGKSRLELDRCLRTNPVVDAYELSLLERGQVRIVGNERFLSMAKALLGENRFRELAAEAKGEVIESRPPTKNPTARFIHRVMESMRACS